jgi:hypothetical protein
MEMKTVSDFPFVCVRFHHYLRRYGRARAALALRAFAQNLQPYPGILFPSDEGTERE